MKKRKVKLPKLISEILKALSAAGYNFKPEKLATKSAYNLYSNYAGQDVAGAFEVVKKIASDATTKGKTITVKVETKKALAKKTVAKKKNAAAKPSKSKPANNKPNSKPVVRTRKLGTTTIQNNVILGILDGMTLENFTKVAVAHMDHMDEESQKFFAEAVAQKGGIAMQLSKRQKELIILGERAEQLFKK